MNERIEEFAELTGAVRYDFDTLDGTNLEELNKFAQLIVQECRDIVEQDMKLAHIQMIPLTLEKYANGRLKEKIKEHFGVEPKV
jgi:hypothetical protein